MSGIQKILNWQWLIPAAVTLVAAFFVYLDLEPIGVLRAPTQNTVFVVALAAAASFLATHFARSLLGEAANYLRRVFLDFRFGCRCFDDRLCRNFLNADREASEHVPKNPCRPRLFA